MVEALAFGGYIVMQTSAFKLRSGSMSGLLWEFMKPGTTLFQGLRCGRMLSGIFFLLITFHFAMVALSGVGYHWQRLGKTSDWLQYYREASGANYQYAFFSPGIKSQIRARFTIKDVHGVTQNVEMLSPDNREANLRISSIYNLFVLQWREESPGIMRRRIAASLAGTIFGRYPEAETVAVAIDEYRPHSLKNFGTQPPPEWKQIYEVEFSKAGKVE
ncbi:MAG TPA: hypothetical protein VFO10_30580 [Oligoflexus sp.]|uniref:hypothetical protein n=1 Tax=Oligoflexus sp. TaxID=1971216 RepID=UPI002D7F02DB|nr:hypothetical protein [Oligoflexus sp.]HET9241653.1 hypothetical protein [Oligoflexus sp.]